MLLYPIGPPHSILVGNLVDACHVQLDISSQPLDESSNPLRLWCDKGLCKAGELGETKLILVDSHITLSEVLEFSKLLVSDVDWDELPEEVYLEGGPRCLISNQLTRTLYSPPPVLCYTLEHVGCQLHPLPFSALKDPEDLLHPYYPVVSDQGILRARELWRSPLDDLLENDVRVHLLNWNNCLLRTRYSLDDI